MTATTSQVDIREAIDLALDLFREFGYRNFSATYNRLLQQYGTFLFQNVGFCKRLEEMLSFTFYAPYGWVETILVRWFEDRTLIRAGFRHLVDREEDNWWRN